MPTSVPPVLLVHGGLAEEIGAEAFWERPGIAPGLRASGFTVIAPDRDTAPTSWSDAALDTSRRVTTRASVLAGSNGVSVAVRMAVEFPGLVDRLVLLWPATAGDPQVDRGAPDTVLHLLVGETLRGVTDVELSGLETPTVVMASDPANPFHAALHGRATGTADAAGVSRAHGASRSRRARSSGRGATPFSTY
jgi:pimeloyl-ACP methyl ester carboxylesterase